MLIPRYSILRLLSATTVAALVALVAGLAIRGTIWAQVLSIAILGLAVVMLVHAALFAVIVLASLFLRRRQSTQHATPPALLPGLLLTLCCLSPVGEALAANSWTLNLPDVKVKPVSGFLIALDSTWVNAPGYRPVRITATATAPSAADRTIAVQFSAGDHSRPGYHTIVEQDIEVPAGTLSATATIAVPQFDGWRRTHLDVWVDGRFAPELSDAEDAYNRYYSYYADNDFTAQTKVLVIGAGNEALRTGASIVTGISPADMNRWNTYQNYAPQSEIDARQSLISGSIAVAIAQAEQLATSSPDLVRLHPSMLPARWIDYSCLDVVVITADDLASLTTNHPQVWEALRRWTAVGGNLWVMGAGDEWQKLPAIEQSLKLSTGRVNSDDPAQRGWLPPRVSPEAQAAVDESEEFDESGQTGINENIASPQEATIADAPAEPKAPPPRTPVALWRREYQLGEVIVFAAEAPFRDNAYLPSEVGDPARMSWVNRHGLVPDVGIYDFWNFLVPGVGLAPVTSFRVLISIFVIAIGPVNYFLLRRWNRLNLLLATVPASAALVTVVLFGYAILSDGLGTRVRLRSYTEIDQSTGTTVAWARQSYYAGLTPRDGMRFATDTVVLPLLPSTSQNGYDTVSRSLAPRHLNWDEEQHLARGWLAARTPTQYETLRAHGSRHQLTVTRDGERVTVDNKLGCHIRHLVLQTESAVYSHQDLAPGARVELAVQKQTPDLDGFVAVLRQTQPQFPLEMQNGTNGGFFQRRYYGGSNLNASQYSSRLEMALRGLSESNEFEEPRLQPGTYAAIVDRSPEIETGLGDVASEEGSLHVVFGRW